MVVQTLRSMKIGGHFLPSCVPVDLIAAGKGTCGV